MVPTFLNPEYSLGTNGLRKGVAYRYSFSHLYQDFRLRKRQYIRYVNLSGAVIVYRELLGVYAVYLLGLVYLDVVYQPV